jgi:hypothetical protein
MIWRSSAVENRIIPLQERDNHRAQKRCRTNLFDVFWKLGELAKARGKHIALA